MRNILLILLIVAGIYPFAGAGTGSGESFNSNGVKLHYVVEGQGTPVVLIHGFHSSIKMNWQAPGILSTLSRNLQVIAIDMPGHGESDKPETETAYGTAMVEDIFKLLDHLKIRKAHIVGYSMGGMIAMKFIAQHQDRVQSGVIGGMGWLREGSVLQNFFGLMPEREGSAVPSACARSFGKLALTEAQLRGIKVPVQVVVGDRDPTKRLYVTQLQQVRKDWPVIEIKDAGHLNCIIKPEFKQLLTSWLATHS
ncbi:MAG TPA: alpha/beta hydrolase [Blastocatellia bacterium]|nr:alpha/beta hydrolase [Blastocatellia bacterium]